SSNREIQQSNRRKAGLTIQESTNREIQQSNRRKAGLTIQESSNLEIQKNHIRRSNLLALVNRCFHSDALKNIPQE
ncbi:MAG: hypothetical protein ACI9CQ_004435, partial [Saprospiraceae bacterium]